MKTPDSRPRFQSAIRHYHRYREEQHDWDLWTEGNQKPIPAEAKNRSVKQVLTWIISSTFFIGLLVLICYHLA